MTSRGPGLTDSTAPRQVWLHAHAAAANFGDQLLVDAIREGVARQAGVRTTYLDACPGPADQALDLSRLHERRTRRAVLEALSDSSAVLVGGGDVLGVGTAFLNLAVMAKIVGRPVAWFGVGGTLGSGRLGRLLQRRALEWAHAVVIRDQRSFDEVTGVVRHRRVWFAADPAFSLIRPPEDRESTGPPEIGVALRGPERHDRMWDRQVMLRLAQVLGELKRQGYREVFLVLLTSEAAKRVGSPNIPGTFTSDDDVVDFVVRHGLLEGCEVVRFTGDTRPVIRRIQRLHLLVGMRLHALLVAGASGVPFIALDYAPKVSQFAARMASTAWQLGPEGVERIPALVGQLEDVAVREHHRQALLREAEGARREAESALAVLKDLARGGSPVRAVRRGIADATGMLIANWARL